MGDSIDWTDETPLRLKAAVEKAFPQGGITISGLRREGQRGRLVIEQIAGKDFTTLRAIADLRKLCRVRRPSPRSANPNALGLCETDLARRSLDAALAKLRAFREMPKAKAVVKGRKAQKLL